MPRWIKRTLGILFLLLLLLTGIYLAFFNEAVPVGSSPKQADELAMKMLQALNNEAYRDTRYLEWSYRGGSNKYIWDKKNGVVEMSWDEYWGKIDLVNPQNSVVKDQGKAVEGETKRTLVSKAITLFNNDSFWLVAPFKIFDKGTERALVDLEDGRTGLRVTYTSGGDTPGDTYLWELNDDYIPEKFSMWVQILPLKGLEATWEGWQMAESGVLLPQYHKVGPITLDLGTVKGRRD
ncbi:MAG: hypothetical protein HKO75_10855 [Flavobacteriaceae bacterium]|nr:hypothetical protein [Muriicola sp.]NNC63058.1 hypothetical protein [Eudoraea sp.]NNK20087.1 hypothetical protein [Flavobacteriaceae bacterium]MBT8289788.1 hypothetical protein [Muriicola sp.]NNK34982.1 hypothetical protein [Eudoraea sp.]